MTPGVHGNVVLGHVLGLEKGRGGNRARANDKERGLETMLIQVVQEVGSVERGTVVVRKTPSVLCGASRDIRVANTSTTCPPTTAGVCGSLCVVWASSSCGGIEGWNLSTGRFDLGNPLLDFWGVGRRNSVKLGIVGGNN